MSKHPHAAAIDRIGPGKVQTHYNMSRQALHKWKKEGIPKMHHNSIRLLAVLNGVNVPELGEQ